MVQSLTMAEAAILVTGGTGQLALALKKAASVPVRRVGRPGFDFDHPETIGGVFRGGTVAGGERSGLYRGGCRGRRYGGGLSRQPGWPGRTGEALRGGRNPADPH